MSLGFSFFFLGGILGLVVLDNFNKTGPMKVFEHVKRLLWSQHVETVPYVRGILWSESCFRLSRECSSWGQLDFCLVMPYGQLPCPHNRPRSRMAALVCKHDGTPPRRSGKLYAADWNDRLACLKSHRSILQYSMNHVCCWSKPKTNVFGSFDCALAADKRISSSIHAMSLIDPSYCN